MITRENLLANISRVRQRLSEAAKKSGRSEQDIKLVAVTKTVPIELIEAAWRAGLTVFGENRVQEALPKIDALPEVCWHFIGRLQTNKAREVVGRFDLVQSLDRWKLAEVLQKRAEKINVLQEVLVQVNLAGEEQKGGISPLELEDFLEAVRELPNLRVKGLMTVPPYSANPEEVRPYFRRLAALFKSVAIPGVEMKYLSMGMSGDFEVAVEEGANMVRIGSAIFGERLE